MPRPKGLILSKTEREVLKYYCATDGRTQEIVAETLPFTRKTLCYALNGTRMDHRTITRLRDLFRSLIQTDPDIIEKARQWTDELERGPWSERELLARQIMNSTNFSRDSAYKIVDSVMSGTIKIE